MSCWGHPWRSSIACTPPPPPRQCSFFVFIPPPLLIDSLSLPLDLHLHLHPPSKHRKGSCRLTHIILLYLLLTPSTSTPTVLAPPVSLHLDIRDIREPPTSLTMSSHPHPSPPPPPLDADQWFDLWWLACISFAFCLSHTHLHTLPWDSDSIGADGRLVMTCC